MLNSILTVFFFLNCIDYSFWLIIIIVADKKTKKKWLENEDWRWLLQALMVFTFYCQFTCSELKKVPLALHKANTVHSIHFYRKHKLFYNAFVSNIQSFFLLFPQYLRHCCIYIDLEIWTSELSRLEVAITNLYNIAIVNLSNSNHDLRYNKITTTFNRVRISLRHFLLQWT